MFRSNEINHKDNWRKVSRRTEEFTAQNAPTVADYEYTYSKGLHLIGKQENEENRRTAYQYDSYYRLRRVDYDCAYNSSDPTCIENRTNVFKCNSSETDCEDFQLDGVHNIRASRENQTDFSWTVDGFNRLTQKSDGSNTVKYTYDSNNNMTGEDLDGDQNADIAYTYDKLNRLTSVTNSDYLVEYSYDPFNRRTEKTVYYTENSDTYEETHKYAYDGWDIISEEIKTVRTSDTPATTVTWQLRRYVDHGTDNHIIMDTVSCSNDGNGNCSPNEPTLQRIWFHKDERGNVTALTDANGNVLERYRYRVYGDFEILDSQFTPKNCNNQTCYATNLHNFLWGGSLYEPETNLYWMRNRYYHIDMHRFINQDPIGIWGDANNLGNGFAYVAGMVIEASDPTGLTIIYLDKESEKNNDSDYPFKACSQEQKALIQAAVDNNSVVRELRKEASNDEAIVYIGCANNSGSFTKKYGKDYRINVGNEDISLEEILAHELTHFLKHKEIIDAKAIKLLEKELAELEKAKKGKDKEKIKELKKQIAELKQKSKKAEKEAVENQNKAKDEEDEKKKKGGEQYPTDPDSSEDRNQSYFANQFIKKIFEMREKKNFLEMMSEKGPVIKYDDNGKKVFIFNPYYRGKDPMKQTYWKTKNADGTNGFVRNPFAPGAEYGYDSTTYEK